LFLSTAQTEHKQTTPHRFGAI